jgi:3-deoxy-7-phosphoheptulonate synthase
MNDFPRKPTEIPRLLQQPDWENDSGLAEIKTALDKMPGIVAGEEIKSLRRQLELVEKGDTKLLQAGDCVEPFAEMTSTVTRLKADYFADLASTLSKNAGTEVLTVGRIAGQLAKPRSAGTEVHEDITMPVFRGEIINGPAPTVEARTYDPSRMLRAYKLSRLAASTLEQYRPHGFRIWISHELLLLDYERSFVRSSSVAFLSSTHLPWIGARTLFKGSEHVALASMIANPVGIKIGPNITPQSLIDLCVTINPRRASGRLVLIIRLGRRLINEGLPPLLQALETNGFRAPLILDPMHGNTVRTAAGRKTRDMSDILEEIRLFATIVTAAKRKPAGLHIETTPFDVTECTGQGVSERDVMSNGYTTLCDPRLNPYQARVVVDAFRRLL